MRKSRINNEIMQKFDKPVKEYHKISEEFPAFHLFGKRGTLLH